MREGIQTMAQYLSDRGWADGHQAKDLPACVTAFFVTCLTPALGDRLQGRTMHEMNVLAESIDHILRGDLQTGLTTLLQRFKCLETSAYDGNFDRGRHLELVKSDRVSCVSAREQELAKQNALQEMKLARRVD